MKIKWTQTKKHALSIKETIIFSMVLVSVFSLFFVLQVFQFKYSKTLTSEYTKKQEDLLFSIANNIQQFTDGISGYARSMMTNPNIVSQINQFEANSDPYEQYVFVNELSKILKPISYSQQYIVTSDILIDGLQLYKPQLNGVFDYLDYPDKEASNAKNVYWVSGWIPTRNATLPLDVDKINIFTYIQAIYSDLYSGEKIGHLLINVNEKELYKLINYYDQELDSIVLLLDENNIVMSSNDRSVLGKNLEELDYRIFTTDDYAKDDYVVSKATLNSLKWQLLSIASYESIVAPVHSVIAGFRVLQILAIIGQAFILLFLASKIAKPIKTLATEIENINVNQLETSVLRTDTLIKEVNTVKGQFNNLILRVQGLVDDIKKNEVEKRALAFDILQEQINPHFLYNTLETINWMALSRGDEDISLMVRKLGLFFRLSLNKGRNYYTVKQEIEHALSYIEIQQIRTSGQISYSCHIDDDVEDLMTIKLLIQPFIENSFIHGFNGKPGVITIEALVNEGKINYKITDNGSGISPDLLKKLNDIHDDSGHGIKNVMRRIGNYYGDEGSVRIDSKLGIGTTVSVMVPIAKGADLV